MKYQFVQSHLNSPWTGIILDRIHRRKMGDLLLILIVRTASGYIPQRRIVKSLDESWTNTIKPFDISHINKDWFNTKTLRKEKYYYFKDRL